jgi:uncharacterized repeat protein (TIGR02543 family)
MKKRLFGMAGALAVLLAFTVLAGCDDGIDTRHITFSAGEGSGTPPVSKDVPEGTSFTLPGQGDMIAPDGKVFAGWRNGGTYDYVVYPAGASFKVTESASGSFTAHWAKSAEGHTITFAVGDGSGTAPDTRIVPRGESTTMPGQGDMAEPPTGRSFRGWAKATDTSSYPLLYTEGQNFQPDTDTDFIAQWVTGHTITFSAGTGSGTPPATKTVEQGAAFTLPGKGDMTAPVSNAFNGWKSADSFTVYKEGDSFTPRGDVTFTAQWKPQGVYVGIISFAGNATDLTVKDGSHESTLYYLDSTWTDTSFSSTYRLRDKLDSYKRATDPGTALYYAVHRALANLTAAEPVFVNDTIHSVNLITFTDGLDNGSYGASRDKPIEDKSAVPDSEYAAYIKGQIANRTIAGKHINAYSIGVKGSDVTDTEGFNAALSSIASAQANVHTLTDLGDLNNTLKGIADTINVSIENTFVMRTPQSSPGTIFRMTFDDLGANPTPAQAASSSIWIEGTLADSGGKYSLINIQSSPGITFSNGTSIEGIESGTTVSFTFNNILGCDPKPATTKQWTKSSAASPSWQINSEYSASGSADRILDTMLVYLVLDASTSLSDPQVATIKTAVTNFITALYQATSGN